MTTTPAPGTTEWFGPVTTTGEDVLSVNMKTYSSAQVLETELTIG